MWARYGCFLWPSILIRRLGNQTGKFQVNESNTAHGSLLSSDHSGQEIPSMARKFENDDECAVWKDLEDRVKSNISDF